MTKRLPSSWNGVRRDWNVLTSYQRFESLVAFFITIIIGAVILVALARLIINVIINVIVTLLLEAHNPLDHTIFQLVFGDIMTLLIALEFNLALGLAYWLIRGGETKEEGFSPAGSG